MATMDICILCWKKDATEFFAAGRAKMCRGCKYEVDRVLNFMHYHGYGLAPYEPESILKEGVAAKPPTPKPSEKPLKPTTVKALKKRQEAKAKAADQQGTLDEALEG